VFLSPPCPSLARTCPTRLFLGCGGGASALDWMGDWGTARRHLPRTERLVISYGTRAEFCWSSLLDLGRRHPGPLNRCRKKAAVCLPGPGGAASLVNWPKRSSSQCSRASPQPSRTKPLKQTVRRLSHFFLNSAAFHRGRRVKYNLANTISNPITKLVKQTNQVKKTQKASGNRRQRRAPTASSNRPNRNTTTTANKSRT
jgi:hypothetical protein